MIEINGQGSYASRTKHNAESAQLTIAFASDFSTAGEKLTKRVSANYLALKLPLVDANLAADALLARLQQHEVRTLNIAGNSLFTLSQTLSFEEVLMSVFHVIGTAHAEYPISKIVTGGQTGVDMIGAIVAVALLIPVCITMPYGFVQRDIHGHDRQYSESEVLDQIEDGINILLKCLHP